MKEIDISSLRGRQFTQMYVLEESSGEIRFFVKYDEVLGEEIITPPNEHKEDEQ